MESGFSLPKSDFPEQFLGINNLRESFGVWVFYPGMLFHSMDIWWKGTGKRRRPHEGLDICYYHDLYRKNQCLQSGMSVPVIYEGEIVKTEKDFLGESAYVRHSIPVAKDRQLYTVYGHLRLSPDSTCGKFLGQGDILGSIADASLKNPLIPSHLHITTALLPLHPQMENVTWSKMHDNEMFHLIDPLFIFERSVSIMRLPAEV